MLRDNHFANRRTLSVLLDRTVLGVFAGTTAIHSHGCHSADGPPQRIKDKGQQRLPGEEAWLIGEHDLPGEKILSPQSAGRDGPAHRRIRN